MFNNILCTLTTIQTIYAEDPRMGRNKDMCQLWSQFSPWSFSQLESQWLTMMSTRLVYCNVILSLLILHCQLVSHWLIKRRQLSSHWLTKYQLDSHSHTMLTWFPLACSDIKSFFIALQCQLVNNGKMYFHLSAQTILYIRECNSLR